MSITKLALSLPWANSSDIKVIDTTGNSFSGASKPVAAIVNDFSSLALFVGGAMVFIWLVWGAYEYIISEGNKEGLAKARARIRWALIGFVILILSFFISNYTEAVLQPNKDLPITPLSTPDTNIRPQK